MTFNLKREDGSWVGHREVEKLSVLSNIQLRVCVESTVFFCFVLFCLQNYIVCECQIFEISDDIDHELLR